MLAILALSSKTLIEIPFSLRYQILLKAILIETENTSILSLPSCTAVSKSGNIVSKPGNPGGGLSVDFSCTVCGALQ